MYKEFTKKRVFGQLALAVASLARHCHGRLMAECDLTDRRVMMDRSSSTPLKISLPENETMVNLKCASFLVIMLLREALTHIQSQIKLWLLFGKSFTLTLYIFSLCNLTHIRVVKVK